MTQAFRALSAEPKGFDGHLAFLDPTSKRVRVMFGGETIADSTRTVMMQETGHQPVYYFPMEDVRMDLFEETDHSTH